jgi:hypothetical protein
VRLGAALLCAAALVPGAALAAGGADLPHDIDAWRQGFIARQHTYDGHRPLYAQDSSDLEYGRLSDKRVAALLFTLQGVRGREDWEQYVAVFWQSGGHFLFCCQRHIGGKGERLMKSLAFEGDLLGVHGLAYTASDPPCCPSAPRALRLRLSHRALSEVR